MGTELAEMPSAAGAAARPVDSGRLRAGRRDRNGRDPDGLSREEVAARQRRRLQAAMIELVGTDGYGAATTRRLSALAGMSKEHMYSHYRDKESYFLATYDAIVDDARRRVSAAHRSQDDWQDKLRAAFDAYAADVVEHPKAARMALLGVLGAGPTALRHMDAARADFERMIASSFAAAPDGMCPPPVIVKGIVCGLERVTRQCLADDVKRLPGLADELLAWALSYRCAAAAGLPEPSPEPIVSARWSAQPLREPVPDVRVAILRAAAELTAELGYQDVTMSKIALHAGVSSRTCTELYGDRERCVLAALSLLTLEMLLRASRSFQNTGNPLRDVHRGIVVLMGHLAVDRVAQRVAFGEVFAIGPQAVGYREELLHHFNALLARKLPESLRPSQVVLEAIIGSIWGLVDCCVRRGPDAARQLPALAGHATYLALAPLIGGEAAVELIVPSGR